VPVTNAGGTTLVTNAGSNGKFLAVMDLDVKGGRIAGYRYRLLPIFSRLVPADRDMQQLIEPIRVPHQD
jgi:sulfur-oxidizing protein SoxB